MRRFRQWFRVHVVTRALEQARNSFQTAKSCADAFHESNAPLFPLTVQLTNEQAQRQSQWIQRRRQTLEEQLASTATDNPESKRDYMNVRPTLLSSIICLM